MKTKIAFIMLALFAGQAQAEWEYITKTVLYELYLDKSTIRKQSGYTLVWTLTNFFKPYKDSTDVYSSTRDLWVVKCGEYQIGLKSLTQSSGNMGSGDVVYVSPSREFHQIEYIDVVPGSANEVVYNVICGIE